MFKVNQEKLKKIENQKRIAELRKLLSDSDWTQVPDVAERKGQSFVDEWKAKRNAWWNEMRTLESE